jgi:membrane protease YdiL (CAAX protease family)
MAQLVPRMGLPLSPAGATVLYVLLGGTFGVARSLANALGEEIGWRGFLVPELSRKMSFTGTAILSGAVWSCWHYPTGHFDLFCFCLDAVEIRKSLDRLTCSTRVIIYTSRESSLR